MGTCVCVCVFVRGFCLPSRRRLLFSSLVARTAIRIIIMSYTDDRHRGILLSEVTRNADGGRSFCSLLFFSPVHLEADFSRVQHVAGFATPCAVCYMRRRSRRGNVAQSCRVCERGRARVCAYAQWMNSRRVFVAASTRALRSQNRN